MDTAGSSVAVPAASTWPQRGDDLVTPAGQLLAYLFGC